MIQYLIAAFFSVLSNCLCVLFVDRGYIVLEKNQLVMDVFLHINIINVFFFSILYNIQKLRGQISFNVVETFRGRQNVVQFLLFVFPVIAAIFKTYMLGFVPVTTITISSLVVPFSVWALAIFLLKEKFRPAYIKYGLLAGCGFVFINLQKMSGGSLSFGYIKYLLFYIFLESIGQITTRYYCRKRSHSLQAVMAEVVIFFVYGGILLLARGTLSLKLLLNPFVLTVALCSFSRHVLLISGVRKASSIVALEFCNFAKPMFACIIMYVLVGEIPTLTKVGGMAIIGVALVRFHALERKYKQENKAIGQKLYDQKTLESVAKTKQ